MSFVDFPVTSGFANNPMTHFARTHYSLAQTEFKTRSFCGLDF